MNKAQGGGIPCNSLWDDYDPDSSAFPPPAPFPATSIAVLLAQSVAERPDKCFSVSRDPSDASWIVRTRCEAAQDLHRISRYLREACSLRHGELVALPPEPSYESLMLHIAALSLGAAVYSYNDGTPPQELRRRMSEEGIRVAGFSLTCGDGLGPDDSQAVSLETFRGVPHVLLFENVPLPGLVLDGTKLVLFRDAGAHATDDAAGSRETVSAAFAAAVSFEHDGKKLSHTHAELIAVCNSLIHSGVLGNGDFVFLGMPWSSEFTQAAAFTSLLLGGSLIFPSDRYHCAVPSSASLAELLSDLRNAHPKRLLIAAETLDRLCKAYLPRTPPRSLLARCTAQAIERAQQRGSDSPSRGFVRSRLDRLLLRRYQAGLFGNRLEACLCSAPPLVSPRVKEFTEALGIAIYEGFLPLSFCGALCMNTSRWNKPGSLGRIFSGIELQASSSGELLARHRGIDALPQATGLIASIDEDGFLFPAPFKVPVSAR